MGQQHRVRIKRKRRVAYLRRKNAARRAAPTRPAPAKQPAQKESAASEWPVLLTPSLQRGASKPYAFAKRLSGFARQTKPLRRFAGYRREMPPRWSEVLMTRGSN